LTITAYRISKAIYAAAIWSGIGARDNGGRWSSPGIAVVYAAENRSLAAMEQLVHLIKPRILSAFVLASIAFDDRFIQRVDVRSLPNDWRDPYGPPALKRIGDNWIASGEYPVLAVPSVIIVSEWNFLLNPAHPEFPRFAKSPAEPFNYDARLR
jgi:RES domain-containing protein